MINTSVGTLPFSRPFEVAALGDKDVRLTVTADASEREALARVNHLAELTRLSADFRVAREGRHGVHVTGTVAAAVRQNCVVTLDPIDAVVDQPVDVHFLPPADLDRHVTSLPPARDDDDADVELPDPIVDGRIDLGALAAEFLTIGLEPFPRKPEAVFVEPAPATAEDSPFALLRGLGSKDTSDS